MTSVLTACLLPSFDGWWFVLGCSSRTGAVGEWLGSGEEECGFDGLSCDGTFSRSLDCSAAFWKKTEDCASSLLIPSVGSCFFILGIVQRVSERMPERIWTPGRK